MMAARTGKTDAITVLLESGAQGQREGDLGRHDRVDVGRVRAPSGGRQGAASTTARTSTPDPISCRRPTAAASKDGRRRRRKPGQAVEEFASGSLTPLMFAAREGDVESARLLVAAGADVNAIAGDGKDALGLAIFNGNYELASFLDRQQVEGEPGRHAGVYAAVLGGRSPQHGNGPELPVDGHRGSASADQEASGRRSEPERPGQQHAAGPHAGRVAADRVRDGIDARGILRRSGTGQAPAVVQGADPTIVSKDGETMVEAAAGLGFIQGYSKGQTCRRTAGGRQAVRGARRRRESRPTTTASRR